LPIFDWENMLMNEKSPARVLLFCTSNFRLAKEHLNNSVTLMREIEMGLWLERAEAELKEVG
jgi:hypothetical protein